MVVDANLWISAALPQDLHHAVSQGWMTGNVGPYTPLELPALVLAEITGAIARRTSSTERARRALRDLRRLPMLHLVPLDHDLAHSAADLAATLRLRGADAVYVAVAQLFGVALVTLDREVAERARAVVRTVNPLEQS